MLRCTDSGINSIFENNSLLEEFGYYDSFQ